MHYNDWYYSPDHGQLCQVIETQTLWGETTCRVWLPGSDSVVRVPAFRLKPLESAGIGSPDDIAYVAAAARVADELVQDVLLAPIESSIIPLPHQIRALSRAISSDRVRYLLADEVGLGRLPTLPATQSPGPDPEPEPGGTRLPGALPLTNEFGLCLSSSANWSAPILARKNENPFLKHWGAV